MASFAGSAAIVTGGARGIGQAVAPELQQSGCSVAIADLVAPAPDAAGWFLKVDVTDAAQVQAMVDGVIERFGHVDVLINSAGCRRVGPSEQMSLEDWSAVLSVNLNSAFLCSQAVARHILGRGAAGSIVNVTSGAAEVGMPGRAPYCASKAGLLGLTRSLAVEWAERGIRVNAVGPGFTRTHMYDWALKQGILSEELIMRRVPMQRLAEPAEVARAIAFLASADAAYITGQTIYVDGGWLAMGIERSS